MKRKLNERSVLLLLLSLLQGSYEGSDTLEVPEYVNCACSGDVLTYRCNIIGGGTTLWGGTTFDCSTTMNEIRLRHSQFPASEGGTMGSCSNGAMQARSIGLTDGNCYTSELTVTVSPSFNTRTVQCAHSPITGPERIISSSMLTILSAQDPPGDVRFTGFLDGRFVLNWTSVLPSCTGRVYYSVASNCSTCSPGVTNLTTGNCSVPQSWTDGLACAFSVQSEVCDNLIGRSSDPVVVKLQVPVLNIIPHYSETNNTLTRFTIRGSNLEIAKSDSRTIYLEEFIVTFSDPDTENVIYSLPTSTCGGDECDIEITPGPPSLSQVCPLVGTIAADYGIGQRLLSDPVTIECTNRLIDVRNDPFDSTISCEFLNRTDTSIKSCSVTYGPCDQQQSQTTVHGMSTAASPNNVTLLISPRDSYCYTVIASNGKFTLAIDGRINIQSDSEGLSLGIIAGVAVVSTIVFSIAIILVVFLSIILLKGWKPWRVSGGTSSFIPLSNLKKDLKLEPIKGRIFSKLKIDKDCKLREAVEYHSKVFKQGHTYYEFTHEKENISVDKELIFMYEVRNKTGHKPTQEKSEYFTSMLPRDYLPLYGEGVRKPDYGMYTVFVQSTGSGARHLPEGSLLLYEQVQSNPWNLEQAPLQPVISNHFMITTIKKECTVEQFQEENKLKKGGASVFIEYGDPVKKDFIRDVILKEKETGKLFTGPSTRSNPGAYLDRYRVFVLQYSDSVRVDKSDASQVKLKPNQSVLHQAQNSQETYTMQPFYVLEVDDDNVQMAEFVKMKLKVKFENGKAFYEFAQMEEDLLYYRDVVLMPKSLDLNNPKMVSDHGNKIFDLKTSLRRFYWLSASVPGIGIKPPSLKNNRVFVQSTSQGSRCLKSKTLLLYRV